MVRFASALALLLVASCAAPVPTVPVSRASAVPQVFPVSTLPGSSAQVIGFAVLTQNGDLQADAIVGDFDSQCDYYLSFINEKNLPEETRFTGRNYNYKRPEVRFISLFQAKCFKNPTK